MRKHLKRTTAVIVLTFLFTTLLSACSDKNNTGLNNPSAEYRIGICQFLEHAAVDSATDGFKAALTEKLGDSVAFDYQNATGDKANAASICNMFAADNYSLIFANSTNSLAAAAEATSEIPIVACSVTDFSSTLGIELSDGKTGFNVTGASDILPLEKQAEVIHELFPDAKNIGILYCSSETNSAYQANEITEFLKAYGYNCTNYTFVDTTDVTLVTQKASEECDVIFTPTDNTVASNTQAINNILEPAKVPLVAGNIDVAIDCGIATIGIEYYDLGYKAGLMAYDILVNDKDPGDMEIMFSDKFIKKYVPERCTLLEIEVPEDYEAVK